MHRKVENTQYNQLKTTIETHIMRSLTCANLNQTLWFCACAILLLKTFMTKSIHLDSDQKKNQRKAQQPIYTPTIMTFSFSAKTGVTMQNNFPCQ